MTYWDGTRWVSHAPAASSTRRHGRFAGAALEALLITGLVFGLIAGTALAGKPARTSASLQVAPSAVAAYGSEFTVRGTGFKASMPVHIVISSPHCCAFTTVDADSSGSTWFLWTSGDPGAYRVDAYQKLNGKKLTLMSSTTFEVTSP